MKKYKCQECGCKEFISNPSRYDIFKTENDKIILKDTEYINEKLELYCRECSAKLEFDENDISY